MTIKPIYSPSDKKLIDRALEEGRRVPWRAKPIAFELRGHLGGRNGREIKRRCATEEEALAVWRHEVERYAAEVSSPAGGVEAYTVRRFIVELFLPLYVMVHQKPGGQRITAAVLDRVILSELGDMLITDVTPLHLFKLLAELIVKPFPVWAPSDLRAVRSWRRGKGPMPTPVASRPICDSDRRRVAVTLKAIFREAKKWGIVEENPARDLPLEDIHHKKAGQRTANKPVEPEIIERVRLELQLRDATLVAVMYIPGTRPSEAAAFIWDDLRDFATGQIRKKVCVRRAVSDRQAFDTKTHRERVIVFFAPARESLARWYEESCRIFGREVGPDEVVFPPLGGRRAYEHLNMASWSSGNLARACRRAGVEPFNAYRLRATCCALLAGGGDESSPGVAWPVAEVAHQLGHSPQVCWEFYYDLFENPGKYRGIPIEQHVREAREAAQRHRADLSAELNALASAKGMAAVVDDLNSRSYPRPDSAAAWTAASARNLLTRAGLTQSDQKIVRSRIRALAELPYVEIAARLNQEGLTNSHGGTWTASAVRAQLVALDLKPVRIGNPRLAEERVAALDDGSRTLQEIADALNAEGLVTQRGWAWKRSSVKEVRLRLRHRARAAERASSEASIE